MSFRPPWLTIMPIFLRELAAASRRVCLPCLRSLFVGGLAAIVLGVFAYYCYEAGGVAPHRLMGLAAQRSFLWVVALHGLSGFTIMVPAALCIAGEKDRRTLDFLLATRLSNAEIVLGKLAAQLVVVVAMIAAGLPTMVLLHALGGIDAPLILLAYAACASTTFLIAAVAIWASTTARDGRHAVQVALSSVMALWVVPVVVAYMLPRFGIQLPRWLAAINAWFLSGSPMGLVMRLAGGLPLVNLVDAVGWLCGVQTLIAVPLLILSVVRLRSAYRVNTGGDGPVVGRAFRRRAWRPPRRPDVGDDPIVWREKYTGRPRGLDRGWHVAISVLLVGSVVLGTGYYAYHAFVEVWNYGYSSVGPAAERPELNLAIRFFLPAGSSRAIDQARIDLNIYLRAILGSIAYFLVFMTPAIVVERIAGERAQETWTSLIGTPLTGREILRSKLLAALWRSRGGLQLIAALETVGALAGAIHPLGLVALLLLVGAWTWFGLALGALGSLRSEKGSGNNSAVSLMALVALASLVLPFLLPARFKSALIGVASLPFDLVLSLASYREVRAAAQSANYPFLEWTGIATSGGLIPAAATCLIGIVAPALGGLFAWRYAVAHFDRLVGRPWKEPAREGRWVVAEPVVA